MRSILMRYTVPFLIILTTLSWGCNGRTDELQKENAALQQQNRELAENLSSQDSYIDEVVTSVNDVYQSIESARAKEKSLLSETKDIEATATRTKSEVRKDLLDRVATINENLKANLEKVSGLQAKLNSSQKKYAALQNMVDNLRKTLEEREQSIASLENRVRGLEGDLASKTEMVRERENTIAAQRKELSTVYYVVGTRDELEKKGIIRKEGGFLWGLLGSTTTLAGNLDPSGFTAIDMGSTTVFRVDGKISEILPRRDAALYTKEDVGEKESVLTVADREHFWQNRYLVILKD
jgi:peptidoglycan hydrolase CwlO-like protein